MSIVEKAETFPTDKAPSQKDFNHFQQIVPDLWAELNGVRHGSITKDSSAESNVVRDQQGQVVALRFDPPGDGQPATKSDSNQTRKPEDPRSAKQIQELVVGLDHDDFSARDKAQTELKELGRAPISALEKALADPKSSAELKKAATEILEHLNSEEQLYKQVKSPHPEDRVGAAGEFEKLGDGASKSRDKGKNLESTYWEQALRALDTVKGVEDSRLLGLLDKLSKDHDGLNFGKKYVQFRERALALAEKSEDPKTRLSLADRHETLGADYSISGTEAEKHYKESLKIRRQDAGGKDTEALAHTLHLVSLTLEYQNKFSEALPYRQGEVDMRTRLGTESSFAQEHLGDIHSELENHGKSIKHYQKSLEIAQRIGPVTRTSGYDKLANAFEKTGDLAQATEIQKKILGIEKNQSISTPPGHPQEFGDRNLLARRELKLGTLLERQDKLSEAEKHLLEAFKYTNYSNKDNLYGEPALVALGDFHQRHRQLDKAEKFYRRAEATFETHKVDFSGLDIDFQTEYIELTKKLIENQKSLGKQDKAETLSKRLEELKKLQK